MNHNGDGIRSCHSGPAVSDGGIDEPGRRVDVMILLDTNDVSRNSDSEEAQWEAMLKGLFTAVWQNFQCSVMTVCTIPMSTRTQSSLGRRHNERIMRWSNIVLNMGSQCWTDDLDGLAA